MKNSELWLQMAPASAVCGELGLPSLERARKLWKSPPKESPPIHGSRGSHGSPYRAFERLYLRPWKSWKSWKLYKTVFKALLQHFLDTKSSISYSFHNFHDFHGLGETVWDALCRLPQLP